MNIGSFAHFLVSRKLRQGRCSEDCDLAVTNPKFEVYTDKAGEFRFRLKAKNGEIIAVGEGYKTKASCLNGIDSIRRNAPEASVEKVES